MTRLAGAKLLLSELYERAAERQPEEQTEAASARARLALRLEELSVRRTLATLVERGLIRPGGGRPFTGVVMFELHALAVWAGAWVPRPVAVADVACGTCGKAGVRLVAEGEPVDGEAVCCATCRPQANSP